MTSDSRCRNFWINPLFPTHPVTPKGQRPPDNGRVRSVLVLARSDSAISRKRMVLISWFHQIRSVWPVSRQTKSLLEVTERRQQQPGPWQQLMPFASDSPRRLAASGLLSRSDRCGHAVRLQSCAIERRKRRNITATRNSIILEPAGCSRPTAAIHSCLRQCRPMSHCGHCLEPDAGSQ